MTPKWKGTIINTLRRLSYTYKPRLNVKNKQKVAPATFECEHCNIWVYEGSKTLDKLDETLSKLSLTPPNGIIKAKVALDHIKPIVPVTGFKRGSWDWDEYIDRMFCGEEGYSVMCKSCHDAKSLKEKDQRVAQRKKTLTIKKK